MNLFQWLTLPVLSIVLLAELLGFLRHRSRWGTRLLRVLLWAAAIVAILHPDITQAVAHAIGIGRGADLVLYLFVLAFLATSFIFYSRYIRLQRQLTEVVRHLAIQNARRGASSSSEGMREEG
jgi:hypothetical protein